MGSCIDRSDVLLNTLRFEYGLSMQEIAEQSRISLASLYRIQEEGGAHWSTQGRLWALVYHLEKSNV